MCDKQEEKAIDPKLGSEAARRSLRSTPAPIPACGADSLFRCGGELKTRRQVAAYRNTRFEPICRRKLYDNDAWESHRMTGEKEEKSKGQQQQQHTEQEKKRKCEGRFSFLLLFEALAHCEKGALVG